MSTYQPGEHPLTAVEIRAHVNLIQEVMRAVMKQDTHYGIIPGCKKPSLWKPGAEVLFTTFRIAVDPVIEDLSTEEEARFRVTARATSGHGSPLGSAVGEASSNEEKYNWREVVCHEEWESTAEDHRRTKWKRGQGGKSYGVQQVLTNIADVRNTVLKMASKRASVALALQVTAASDIFTQDIEDVPEEAREAVVNGDAVPLPVEIRKKEPQSSGAASPTPAPAAPQSAAPSRPTPIHTAPPAESRPVQRPPIQSPRPQQVRVASEAQGRRFYAKWKSSGKSQDMVADYLRSIGAQDEYHIPLDRYEEACKWADEDF